MISEPQYQSVDGETARLANDIAKLGLEIVVDEGGKTDMCKDMEEFKQQIQKQKRQFNKAKKEFLKYFPAEKTEVLEIEPEEKIIEIEKYEQKKVPREHKLTERETQMNIPIFSSNYEKYEWLMQHGCTNQEQRKWLGDYIRSDEYINLYGD